VQSFVNPLVQVLDLDPNDEVAVVRTELFFNYKISIWNLSNDGAIIIINFKWQKIYLKSVTWWSVLFWHILKLASQLRKWDWSPERLLQSPCHINTDTLITRLLYISYFQYHPSFLYLSQSVGQQQQHCRLPSPCPIHKKASLLLQTVCNGIEGWISKYPS
jgi:hypothetical protein